MANLTGLTTNFFPTASETYANNLSSSISALAATVPVNSANEYTDGDVATITVDAGTPLEATFTGVKASTPARFINCIWTEGNLGVGHASGATVIDYDSATHMSQVSKGILQQHKQSGAHSNITADSIAVNGSITATGDVTEAGVTARTFRTEVLTDFVVSGGVWSQLSGLNGQMTAVTAYITGYRNSIVAVASRAFTASKDTYVDILRTTVGAVTTFTLVYTEVANGAASPALAANSLRLAKVVTSGVAITSVVQSEKDSLSNRIYPDNPVAYNSIDFQSFPFEVTGMYENFYTLPAQAGSSGNSYPKTISLPRALATGERVMVIPFSLTWCVVDLATPTVAGSTSFNASVNCVVTTGGMTCKFNAIYYKAH